MKATRLSTLPGGAGGGARGVENAAAKLTLSLLLLLLLFRPPPPPPSTPSVGTIRRARGSSLATLHGALLAAASLDGGVDPNFAELVDDALLHKEWKALTFEKAHAPSRAHGLMLGARAANGLHGAGPPPPVPSAIASTRGNTGSSASRHPRSPRQPLPGQ
eukprot:5139388-Pyramimonas_sp.AAC.1